MLRFPGTASRQSTTVSCRFTLWNASSLARSCSGRGRGPPAVRNIHKKAILVERGSFRPVTHVNVDMIACATAAFVQESPVKSKEVVVLMESPEQLTL